MSSALWEEWTKNWTRCPWCNDKIDRGGGYQYHYSRCTLKAPELVQTMWRKEDPLVEDLQHKKGTWHAFMTKRIHSAGLTGRIALPAHTAPAVTAAAAPAVFSIFQKK